jgi:hypothetical protein
MRLVRHVASKREENSYRILSRMPEGKIPVVRPRRRWEDNIKMVLQKI